MAEAVGKTFTPWSELPWWRRARYRVEFAGLWAASRLVPLLPWPLVRALAAVLGRIIFLVDRRSREIALANLEMVFGTEKSPAEIRRIARDSAVHFARTMLELFWARNFTADNYRDYMVMEGWEQARELNRKHQGGIFVCLHYGNFEWLSIAGAFERLPGCIVTQQFRNPLLGPIFDRLRALSGHRIISQERSMLVTLKHLKNGGNIGILFDLQLDPRHPAVPMRSFGRWRPATKIHAMLQRRTGLPIIPIESVPLPDGRYRTIAHDPIYFSKDASEEEIVQACWDFFEPQVHRQPEAWLWAYRHWRFLPPDAQETYPFYAETKGRFTRLLQGTVASGPRAAQDQA
jgi:KDO2-lipid IV(A) lauroyltransferase